jgi:hypothetical protein
MKKCDALRLQAGDLVDVLAAGWRSERSYGRKVLIVSSKGGIYIAWGAYECPRWSGSIGSSVFVGCARKGCMASYTMRSRMVRATRWRNCRPSLSVTRKVRRFSAVNMKR